MSYFEDNIEPYLDMVDSRNMCHYYQREAMDRGYWVTATGEEIHITQLDEDHIRRILKLDLDDEVRISISLELKRREAVLKLIDFGIL